MTCRCAKPNLPWRISTSGEDRTMDHLYGPATWTPCNGLVSPKKIKLKNEMNYKNYCWLWPKEIVKKGLVFPMLKCCFFQSFLVSLVGRLFYGGFLILTEQMWFLPLCLRFLRGERWSVSCILISCIFLFLAEFDFSLTSVEMWSSLLQLNI